jgi:RHS repeat-associated protein
VKRVGYTRPRVAATKSTENPKEYNVAGQLISTTYGSAVTTLTYDLSGRKIAMDDADMGAWEYAYDALGNLRNQTDARGCETTLDYDPLNRLVSKTFANCPGNSVAVSCEYDQSSATNSGIGRRTGMNDASGSTAWEYDLRGRLIHEAKTVIDPQGNLSLGTYNTYWSYNSDDSVRQMVYPNQETVNIAYHPQGTPSSLYTILSQETSDVTYRYAADLAYDGAGRLVNVQLGNGVNRDFTFYPWSNQGGRLQGMTAQKSGPYLQNMGYTYDANGNILSIADDVAFENLNFVYDDLNRLDEANGTYNENPEYDPDTGNIDSRNGIGYLYNDPTHLHAVTSTSNGQAFGYDADGNMTIRTVPAGSYTLEYDAESHLTSMTGSGLEARYVYDGDGKRLLAVVNGVRTLCIGDYFEAELAVGTEFPITVPPLINYDLCHNDRCYKNYFPLILGPDGSAEPLIGMTEGNFGTTLYHTHPVPPGQGSISWRLYYYAEGSRIGMRVSSDASDEVYYLLTDHLGSTSQILDDEGNAVSELHYNAWGETRYSEGSIPTDHKYTGQLEAEAGLYFYGARWYDPSIMRFVQPDTVIPEPNNSQSFDRYSYALNNPVRYTDPSGYFTEDEIKEILGFDKDDPWEKVLELFQKGGKYEDRWGWLDILTTAEIGDQITIDWGDNLLPKDHPSINGKFQFEYDAQGKLILTGDNFYFGSETAGLLGEKYTLNHYVDNNGKKVAVAFLVIVTDFTVGLPGLAAMTSGNPVLAIAGEYLETTVVLPVNLLAAKMWLDAEKEKFIVLTVQAIPSQDQSK